MNPGEARALFGAHARSYDHVNRIISLGMDRGWRRWAARQAATAQGSTVIELMAGTGEVAVEAARLGAQVTAADVSEEMLARARERAQGAHVTIRTLPADVTDPDMLAGQSFDSAVVSFGLRYVEDPVAVLRNVHALLHPHGRLILLEFCVPRPGLVSSPAALYFFEVLPRLAGVLGAGPDLYEYLRDSTRQIGTAERIERIVRDAGFQPFERRAFGFGLVFGLVSEARRK